MEGHTGRHWGQLASYLDFHGKEQVRQSAAGLGLAGE